VAKVTKRILRLKYESRILAVFSVLYKGFSKLLYRGAIIKVPYFKVFSAFRTTNYNSGWGRPCCQLWMTTLAATVIVPPFSLPTRELHRCKKF